MFIISIIIAFLLVVVYCISANVRAIVNSFFKLCLAGIRWLINRFGARAFFIVLGAICFIALLLLLTLWIGYSANLNWIIRPALVATMVLLLIFIGFTDSIARWFKTSRVTVRNLAQTFMILCIVLIWAEGDIVLFKQYLPFIAGFILFCLFWVAFGAYIGKTTNATGYLLAAMFVVSCIYTIYTHVDNDRWVANRNLFLAKRGVGTNNINSEAATLESNWKVGFIKTDPVYRISVTNNSGNFIKQSTFLIQSGSTILVCPNDTTAGNEVKKSFRNLPVYKIASINLEQKEVYWILQANVQLSSETGGGTKKEGTKSEPIAQSQINHTFSQQPRVIKTQTIALQKGKNTIWELKPQKGERLIIVPGEGLSLQIGTGKKIQVESEDNGLGVLIGKINITQNKFNEPLTIFSDKLKEIKINIHS